VRQAAKAGIGFTALDNGFAACEDPDRLQPICDRLSPARIDALLRKWLRTLPHPFTAADRGRGAGDLRLGLVNEKLIEAHDGLAVLLVGRSPGRCRPHSRIRRGASGARSRSLDRHRPRPSSTPDSRLRHVGRASSTGGSGPLPIDVLPIDVLPHEGLGQAAAWRTTGANDQDVPRVWM